MVGHLLPTAVDQTADYQVNYDVSSRTRLPSTRLARTWALGGHIPYDNDKICHTHAELVPFRAQPARASSGGRVAKHQVLAWQCVCWAVFLAVSTDKPIGVCRTRCKRTLAD
jgi:hypothetical protein